MSTSFWLDRTAAQKTTPREHFDVVIIGAGITGLSVAYWLEKEDPSLKIGLVEKSRLAFGASGRNAGFITCGSVEHFNRMISKHGLEEASQIWKFSEVNLSLLEQEIIQEDKEALGFEKKGSYSLAAQATEFEELKKCAQIMSQMKIPVNIHGQSEIEKSLGTKNFVGGIHYVDDASVNPVKLVEKIYSRLKNTTLFESTEVHSVTEGPDSTRWVNTDNGTFVGNMVVFALNGYSSSLHPYFADKIYPTRGQVLMMEKVPRFMAGPCYANFYLDYFRQLPSGELLIGGFRQLEKATEVGYSDHTTDTIQGALLEFVRTHLPQFENKKVTHRWAGVMGFSKDGQPLIGSLPDDGQTFFVGGYTAHGIGLAFNSSKSLVDLIYGRSIPQWISARRM